jgi:hypothetical protein
MTRPFERKSGSLDHDLSLDGDKVRFILRPMRFLVFSSYFITPVMIGLGLGAAQYYVLFERFYMNPRYDIWAVYSCAVPPVLGLIIGLFLTIPRIFVRYEISRRFIRVISGIFIESIENVDMKRVKDTKLQRYGVFASISIISTDKTMQDFDISFIPTDDASEAFLFINDVAIDDRTELLLATSRGKRAKTKHHEGARDDDADPS